MKQFLKSLSLYFLFSTSVHRVKTLPGAGGERIEPLRNWFCPPDVNYRSDIAQY